jgi:ADP-ribose pyrophosphatase YjhB (NUDIX family)
MLSSVYGLNSPGSQPERHWTVAVFVVHEARLLMMYHRKYGKWLPPGGHIEAGETPDEAAIREVAEETGVSIVLLGEPALDVDEPQQLCRPRGVQLERIAPGHEHINLVYIARAVGDTRLVANNESTQMGWYDAAGLAELDLTAEIRQWVTLVLRETSL